MDYINNINKAKLSDIFPFKDGENWYLKLIYKYEDEYGKHMVVIPKAAIPFTQIGIPPITRLQHFSYGDTLEHPYMTCNSSMSLFESRCNLAIKRGVTKSACYFDIITEFAPKPKEMTLDEIEKELGYKVKIINEDDDIKETNNKNE